MNIPRGCLLLILCGLTALSEAHANQQENLDRLRQRIAAMQRDMEKTSESKVEAADALRESEQAISNSNRRLAELALQQQVADQKLAQLQAQQRQAGNNIAGQQTLLGKLLYQQYLGGQQEYAKLLLENQDPNQVARDLQYYGYISRNRAAWLNVLRDNFSTLNSLSTATKTQLAEVIAVRTEQIAQKQTLQREQRKRQHVLGNISQQLRSQHNEINRLQRNENRLAKLLERITRVLAQSGSDTPLHNNNVPDDRFDGSPFEKLKGKLAFPVKGDIINRFGAPHSDSSVLWKGVFVRASGGQAVKAIAAGRVVFADWLRGFGNLLIIDHGKGYMSLYANNETLYKQVGDTLRGGDTIASVGNSGGNEESGLYFELRLESKPLDPLKWLATK